MWTRILLLFFVFSFLFRTDHSFDQDLGRHLKIGEIIWQTHNIPLTNLFSYTYPDFPFINSHWLFEALAYLNQQAFGLQSLLVFKLVILLLAVWLILKTIPKNQYLILPVGFIFLHTLRERPELRPEIFSFLFTALTLFVLEKYLNLKQMSSGRSTFVSNLKLIYVLPLIQLLWVNTHIYFIVGLALQGIYLIHLGYQYLRSHTKGVELKILMIIFILSVFASLINPSGLKGFLNPFLYGSNYGYTIVENQTMFLLESIDFRDPNFLFVKMTGGIIVLSIVVTVLSSLRKRHPVPERYGVSTLGVQGSKKQNYLMDSRIRGNDKGEEKIIKNVLLALFGLTLALMNVRSFPYLALISLPAVLENFESGKAKSWHKILIFITIPILLYESFLYLNGDYYKYTNSDVVPKLEFQESGKSALDFVLKENLPQPIFNNFDIGSYITYRGWPEYRIFVDGRPGEYPKEFFQQVYIPMQSDPQIFKEIDKQYGFKTIIFSHTDQTPWGKIFLQNIVKNPDWKTVYIDDFMIILVKNSILASKGDALRVVDLAKLEPATYKFDSYLSYLRLSLFLAQTGNLESTQKFTQAGLKLFPQSPLGNALFGIEVSSKIWW